MCETGREIRIKERVYFTLPFAQIYDIMEPYGYKKYPKTYSFWEGESYEEKEKQ